MLTYAGVLFCAWRDTALLLFDTLSHLRSRKVMA
jgi:hypothetical protein